MDKTIKNEAKKNMSTPSVTTSDVEVPNIHWADHLAEKLIELHSEKSELVCASGISPSGVVHIGNFREVITVDFVVRALRERGKKVRFIYSWDDYDAFRKVPANMPKPELLRENLRKPLSSVPDPYGDCSSYARHFESLFEKEISQLGIFPDYVYQNEPYRNGNYLKGVREALENEKKIVEILNRFRTEPLPEDWTCISIFCTTCQKDATKFVSFDGKSTFKYFCKICKKESQIDALKEGGVKLLWRVDWPMRWAAENVDFEPGGKDHSSQGGSRETGEYIIREVWKKEPPLYQQYDFVLVKGGGAKLSSSSGQLITLGEALEIYEPQVIRYIFSSRKPNTDFSIAFDLDVMKAYDDFDRTERIAFGLEDVDDRRRNYEKRIYEFSLVKGGSQESGLPAQFGFRHLCNLLQIQQGDLEKTKKYFELKDAIDEKRFEARATRAWKWITSYAPEEFRFSVRTDDNPPPKTQYSVPMKELVGLLRSGKLGAMTEDQVANEIYQIIKKSGVEPKIFFQETYRLLISKTSGPKLASFIVSLGTERAAAILEKAL
jgi:lysyl-tRNA synthetase, class I